MSLSGWYKLLLVWIFHARLSHPTCSPEGRSTQIMMPSVRNPACDPLNMLCLNWSQLDAVMPEPTAGTPHVTRCFDLDVGSKV